MDPSMLYEAVDLSQFSAAECSRIWEVLQRDFQVRYEETRNINRIQTRVTQANEKINLLGEIDKFNDKYCIVCFDSFIFIINPSYVCYMCECNVCKKCSRVINKVDGRLCQLCHEEHYLVARQCSWFYEKKRTFVVGSHPTALSKDRLEEILADTDPVTAQMRRYLAEFVARYKLSDASANTSERDFNSKRGSLMSNGAAIPPEGGRDENEEVLKRITGMQIMRFQQKMNTVATEVRSFLRKDVSYEIPEAGVDRHYDMKIKNFNDEVINILRNFSQTLYIAIEGYHSRTGKPLRNVHQEVLFILQDEVENLVGYRVDVRQDDEVASMVSDDEITSSLYGPGNIQEKLSHILMDKWIADHQSYLDDQKVTASDLYTHNALEDFLNKKSHDSMDYRRLSLDDEWQQPDEDFIQSRRNKGVFCGAPTGLNEVDPDMLSLQDSRQLEGSVGGSSSGTGNWLLKGKPSVTGNYGESMHHFDDTPSPRIGRKNAFELSDELSESDESDEDDENSFLSEVEKENERKKSSASIDFDDVYNQNLTLYSDTTPEKTQEEAGVKSEDSGVHVNGTVSSPVTRVESIGSEGSGKARKVSLGFLRMDWSFSERSDPCFISKTTEVSCKVAECASISVEVDGTMPIDVYWYRASSDDLVQLEENDRIEFVSANDHPGKHTLYVWHVEVSDEGEYLAVAVNQQGSNKQGFKISVLPNDQSLKAPEFQRPLSNDEVRKGETGRLRCKVAGYPHPRVVFMRDGKHISNNDKFQLMRIGERAYTLSIHDVQPEDKGVYSCIAANAAGSCQSEATLDVVSSPSNPAPRFDGEMLVDTSPAVNVRSQVQKLGKDELTPGSTLFVDKVEPLTKPSTGDIDVKSVPTLKVPNAHPSRRRDLLDVNKPRGNGRLGMEVKEEMTLVRVSAAERASAKVQVVDNTPKKAFDEPVESKSEQEDEQNAFNDLLLDLSDDERRIDCGLKPVNDRYKRDFVIKQESPASEEPKSSLMRPVTSTAKRIELKLKKPPEPEVPSPVEPTPKEPLLTEDVEDAIDFTAEKQEFCAVEPTPRDMEESTDFTTENLECKGRLQPENHVISFNVNPPENSVFDCSSEDEEQLTIAMRKEIGWNPWVEENSYPALKAAIPKRREMDWNPKSPVKKEGSGDRIELEEDVNTLKKRFERGMSNPHQPNPYASFRTRKFPSVAAIKDQFSTTPPPRGSYVKRLPDLQEELSIPKRSSSTSIPVRRSNTLPSRSSVQPTGPSSRLPKPQPTRQDNTPTTSSASKDKVVVPEFFHVKLKPTGRQIDN